LAEKQQIFASNIASKCAIFPLFLTVFSLQPIHLSSYEIMELPRLFMLNKMKEREHGEP
jgi:hypothetical protein